MERTHTRPAWLDRQFTMDDDDVLPVNSAVYLHQGSHYFTGLVREFYRLRKPPRSIAMHYDASTGSAVARLEYEEGPDGYNADERLRAVYAPIEPESFALLWNALPEVLHGSGTDRTTLHLTPGDHRLPTIIPPSVGAVLYHDPETDRFRIAPDEDVFLDDLAALPEFEEKEAA